MQDLRQEFLPPNITVSSPTDEELCSTLSIDVTIAVLEGVYSDAKIPFKVQIDQMYPHRPPRVFCLKKIFHPSVGVNRNVCLNILRLDWSPVLAVNAVVFGIHLLLLEPQAEDCLNAGNGFQP